MELWLRCYLPVWRIEWKKNSFSVRLKINIFQGGNIFTHALTSRPTTRLIVSTHATTRYSGRPSKSALNIRLFFCQLDNTFSNLKTCVTSPANFLKRYVETFSQLLINFQFFCCFNSIFHVFRNLFSFVSSWCIQIRWLWKLKIIK